MKTKFNQNERNQLAKVANEIAATVISENGMTVDRFNREMQKRMKLPAYNFAAMRGLNMMGSKI